MSLQGVIVTLSVGIAAIAAIAFVLFDQQRHREENHNHSRQEYRAIRNDTCGVCLEEKTHDIDILRCGHWMHGLCLRQLRRNTDYFSTAKCPFCRTPID